jgi:cyclohexyl-isocyanide hydratase
MNEPEKSIRIAMVIYPEFTLLDLVGPHAMLNVPAETHIDLLWHRIEPVIAGGGLPMTPTATFADYGTPDVLFVPGGPAPAILGALGDDALIDYVAAAGAKAGHVTSVCTGALILGAAGLLKGKRAATHWMFMDQLPLFGAEPVSERVVEDGNILTGGGVTAGIDFGLTLLARLLGDDVARRTQLLLEYDPAPPFDAGSPDKAGPVATEQLRRFAAEGLSACREAAMRIGRERLGIGDS